MTSFLDDLRATGRHITDNATKDLDVPGRGGGLAVRYRPPPRSADDDPVAPVIAGFRSRGALSVEREKQFIVDCHDQVLRRNDDGELEPYDPPLRFDAGDERWGDDVHSARDCVAKLFALDEQPAAAAGHADALIDWLQGLDAELAGRVEEAGKARTPAPS